MPALRDKKTSMAFIAVSMVAASGAMACEPVTAIPANLAGGVFCLVSDLTTDGRPAIQLGDDATLDCQGHRISDATLSTSNAVIATGDNIEVKNCVFEGFGTPLWVRDATHYRVIANTFVSPMDEALYIVGNQGLVAHNLFRYPAERYPGYPASWYSKSIAISTWGIADIIDNTIAGVRGAGDGRGWTLRIGIFSQGNTGGLLARNVVKGLIPGAGYDRRAIIAEGSLVVFRNVVAGAPVDSSSPYDEGLHCQGQGTISAQNIAVGFRSDFVKCNEYGNVGLQPDARHP